MRKIWSKLKLDLLKSNYSTHGKSEALLPIHLRRGTLETRIAKRVRDKRRRKTYVQKSRIIPNNYHVCIDIKDFYSQEGNIAYLWLAELDTPEIR